MGKLHEALAVEGSLKGAYTKVLKETIATLRNKAEHFLGWNKSYAPFDDNDQSKLADEHHTIVTTVDAKLDYMFSEHIIPYLDVVCRKSALIRMLRHLLW